MALNLPFPPIPESAPRFAALAVDAALRVDNVCLDYSPASLGKVEAMLERLRGEGARTEQVGETLFAFGCYLGEMFVRAGKGRWRATSETPMKDLADAPLLVEFGNGDYCNPLGRVRKCFDSGPGEGLARFWQAFASEHAVDQPPRRSWWRRLFGR